MLMNEKIKFNNYPVKWQLKKDTFIPSVDFYVRSGSYSVVGFVEKFKSLGR